MGDIYGRRPRFCERSLCERSARLWRRSKERKEEERNGGFRARQLHSHSRATTQRTKELDDCRESIRRSTRRSFSRNAKRGSTATDASLRIRNTETSFSFRATSVSSSRNSCSTKR